MSNWIRSFRLSNLITFSYLCELSPLLLFFFLSHIPLPPLSFLSKPSHQKKIYFKFLGVSRQGSRKKKKKKMKGQEEIRVSIGKEDERRNKKEKELRPTERVVRSKCSLTLMGHDTKPGSTRVKIYKNVMVTHNSSSKNKKNLFSVFTTQMSIKMWKPTQTKQFRVWPTQFRK